MHLITLRQVSGSPQELGCASPVVLGPWHPTAAPVPVGAGMGPSHGESLGQAGRAPGPALPGQELCPTTLDLTKAQTSA